MKRDCRISRYLSAYLDGELSPRLLRRVEAHVARCDACARELDALRGLGSILKAGGPPPVSGERWSAFGAGLSKALDRVDAEEARPRRVREFRPVYGTVRRRALAGAAVCVATAIAIVIVGPADLLVRSGTGGAGVCVVESIETFAAGYTPMCFTSSDPEVTVIWVFSDDVEPGLRGEGPGTP